MSRDLNKAFVLGRLGTEPKKREQKNGGFFVTFPMATEVYLPSLQAKETTWHNVVVWGKAAERCVERLTKGAQVLIEGHFRSSKFENSDGKTQYSYEIHADRVTFLQNKNSKESIPVASESQDLAF